MVSEVKVYEVHEGYSIVVKGENIHLKYILIFTVPIVSPSEVKGRWSTRTTGQLQQNESIWEESTSYHH